MLSGKGVVASLHRRAGSPDHHIFQPPVGLPHKTDSRRPDATLSSNQPDAHVLPQLLFGREAMGSVNISEKSGRPNPFDARNANETSYHLLIARPLFQVPTRSYDLLSGQIMSLSKDC
jgi:hypothetical protein